MGKIRNIGIIGVGRWGANYLRTLLNQKNAKVKWICSGTQSTINKAIKKVNPNYSIKTTTNYKDILKDKEVDAVIIATPGSTHYKITKESLLSNKHVLVEKPFCMNSKHAEELAKISKKQKKILMVGHLHLFNPGIQKLSEDIKRGKFGKLNYIDLTHTGNGPIRSDMSALWDFLPHTVSILLYLTNDYPKEVSVIGKSFIKKGIEDIIVMNLKFSGNLFVTSLGSWLNPLKKMEVIVAGEQLYATFDDCAKVNKLKYHDNRPKVVNGKAIIDDKGIFLVKFKDKKPLNEQVKYFLSGIEKGSIKINNPIHSIKITKVLEAAQISLKRGGALVKISK
jgi:predicted dehydrogenase